jgi:hypothetical protein
MNAVAFSSGGSEVEVSKRGEVGASPWGLVKFGLWLARERERRGNVESDVVKNAVAFSSGGSEVEVPKGEIEVGEEVRVEDPVKKSRRPQLGAWLALSWW